MTAPPISRTNSETTLTEIRKKAPFYVPEWNTEDERDFGIGLSRIFANMSETITSRLNEAPHKHFLSFLEMLGSSLNPANPARVPLTFVLSEGASENVLVESSVQASGKGPDGKPVIFETKTNIIATPSKLVSVFSVIKDKDEIFEHTEAINGTAPAELFTGDSSLQEHVLYIGDEKLFNLKEGYINVIFDGIDVNLLSKLEQGDIHDPKDLVEWKYGAEVKEKKDGKEVKAIQWCRLGRVIADTTDKNKLIIEKYHFLGECKEIETGAVIADIVQIDGVERRWIKCEICENQIDKFKDLSLTGLKVSVSPLKVSVNKGGSVKKVQGIGDVFYSKLAGNNRENKIETVDELLKLNEEELAVRLQCSRKRAQNILEAARKQFFDKTIDAKDTTGTGISGKTNLQGIAPDLLYYNDIPIPIESQIYPFGTKPQIYDIFYIASEDAFSKKGYDVTLKLKLDPGKPSPSNNSDTPNSDAPLLSWEYWDGESWSILKIDENAKRNFSDNNTSNKSIDLDFKISDMPGIKPLKVNGKENYWIRIRLVGGNYGKEYEIDPGSDIAKVKPGTFCPPIIKEFKITYDATGKETQPEYIFATNNLELTNFVDELKTHGKSNPFKALSDTYPALYFGFDRELKKGPFSLFISIDESIGYPESFRPKVRWQYIDEKTEDWKELEVVDETLGFTKMGMVQFSVSEKMKASQFFGSGYLYWIRAVITGDFFNKEPLFTGTQEFSSALPSSLLPYLEKTRPLFHKNIMRKRRNLSRIEPLKVMDFPVVLDPKMISNALKVDEQSLIKGSNVLTEARISHLPEIKECEKDFELFNIDLIPEDLKKLPPKVLGFYLNSVWAVQSRTIRDEILGSGNGEADQKFRLINTPVIDETIRVNENSALSENEKQILLEDPSNVNLRKDNKGNILEFWVRWTAVPALFDSASKDRHYIIDRTSGEISFGDGKHGMVPPIGANNIRATYSIGGGRSGNLDALAISKLQSSIAFADKVFNPVSSEGGSETEDIESLLNRAPVILKHRNRAMAAEDYEWLAKEASRNVSRVRVLPNFSSAGKFSTGCVTVIIVPESSDPQPVPSTELKRQVTEHLTERCPAVVNLKVMPPLYVQIDVSAELVTGVIDATATIEMEAKRRISEFLHPLTGSAEGRGWGFGFAPCISDIYSILEKIAYVDHVNNITIGLHNSSKVMKIDDVSAMVKLPEYALPCNGEHEITVKWENSKKEGD